MTTAAGTHAAATLLAAAPTVPVPSWFGVSLSLVLVAVALVVIVRQRLGLARELAVAAARAAVQLVIIGALLQVLLTQLGVPGSLVWVALMVLVAGRVSAGRGKGLHQVQLTATTAIGVGTVATLGLLLAAGVIEAQARVVLPIGGMVVSAAMQGSSLTLLRMRDEVVSSARQTEARLSLGQSGREAFAQPLRRAVKSALVPPIDQTKVVGLISLPGAMTGLIIAGVDPIDAIRYQVVVMYMILGAASLASLVSAQLGVRRLFDEGERVRELEAGLPLLPWRASRPAPAPPHGDHDHPASPDADGPGPRDGEPVRAG